MSSRPATPSLRSLLRALPVFAVDLPVLDLTEPPLTPEALFVIWLQAAIEAGEPEPHAMALSTNGADGVPDARILILKDLDDRGWWFAGDRTTVKGRELASSPYAALTFHWKGVGRQVRVRGVVVTGTPAQSERDFLTRSAASRASAAVADWTAYALQPTHVEFWQANPSRLHHRLRYERDSVGGWRTIAAS